MEVDCCFSLVKYIGLCIVIEGGGGVRKHTRLRSPDEMELMELRLFAAAPLTPRGVLSEDMIFFFFSKVSDCVLGS